MFLDDYLGFHRMVTFDVYYPTVKKSICAINVYYKKCEIKFGIISPILIDR